MYLCKSNHRTIARKGIRTRISIEVDMIREFPLRKSTRQDTDATKAKVRNPKNRSRKIEDIAQAFVQLYFVARYALMASGATLEGKNIPRKLVTK
jgi:hypothetical protein